MRHAGQVEGGDGPPHVEVDHLAAAFAAGADHVGVVLGEEEVVEHFGEDGAARVHPDEIVQDDETLRHMLELVDRLEDREQRILKLRFGLGGERPHTLEEVSRIIGRTRERIRQIQNQALEKLRQMLEEEAPEMLILV